MIVQELFSVLGLKVDEKSFDAGEKAMSGIKTIAAAAIGVFAVDKLVGVVAHVAELGDHAADTAQSLGITAEAVQELGHAAEVGGSSAGELEGGLQKLAMSLGQLEKGKGPAVDALNALGVSAKDLKGESLDQNLEVIADAFAKMPDGVKKTNLAIDLFGKSGAKLIPFLNNGAEGIVDMRNEAHELGLVMSEDTAEGLGDLKDNAHRLGAVWEGIKIQVVSGLLPALSSLIENFREWLAENRELIASGLQGLLTGLTFAFKAVGFAVQFVLNIFSALAKDSEALMGILIAFGVILGQMAVKAAAAWVAAAAPIVITTLAIAALGVATVKIIKHWDKVKEVLGKALDFALDKLDKFKDAVLDVPSDILHAFEFLGEQIVDAFVGAFDFVIQKAKELGSAVWKEVKNIPVIGRLASGGESLLSSAAVTPDAILRAQQAVQANTEAVSAGGGQGSFNATFGDTNMQVVASPGMDETKLAELAAQKATEAQKRMLSDAAAAVRGGRR